MGQKLIVRKAHGTTAVGRITAILDDEKNPLVPRGWVIKRRSQRKHSPHHLKLNGNGNNSKPITSISSITSSLRSSTSRSQSKVAESPSSGVSSTSEEELLRANSQSNSNSNSTELAAPENTINKKKKKAKNKKEGLPKVKIIGDAAEAALQSKENHHLDDEQNSSILEKPPIGIRSSIDEGEDDLKHSNSISSASLLVDVPEESTVTKQSKSTPKKKKEKTPKSNSKTKTKKNAKNSGKKSPKKGKKVTWLKLGSFGSLGYGRY